MKKVVYIISLVLISASVYGQKVDFSGTWKLNKQESELGYDFSMAPHTMIIKHDKKTLEAEKHNVWQDQEFVTTDNFTLDGKECENPGWRDSVKKSTANWNKKTEVLKINTTVPMQDGGEATIVEEYVMNGENLIVEVAAASSMGEMTERYVFDKQ